MAVAIEKEIHEKYKDRRIEPNVVKKYGMYKSGADECYPRNMLMELVAELEKVPKRKKELTKAQRQALSVSKKMRLVQLRTRAAMYTKQANVRRQPLEIMEKADYLLNTKELPTREHVKALLDETLATVVMPVNSNDGRRIRVLFRDMLRQVNGLDKTEGIIMHGRGYWTYDRCAEQAAKFRTRFEWKNESQPSYKKAMVEGWIDDLMPKAYKSADEWTLELLMESASKYTTRGEWFKGHSTAYKKAKELGYFEQCTEHMVYAQKPNNYWTKERCLATAAKCLNSAQWREEYNVAYQTARRNGWTEEVIACWNNN